MALDDHLFLRGVGITGLAVVAVVLLGLCHRCGGKGEGNGGEKGAGEQFHQFVPRC